MKGADMAESSWPTVAGGRVVDDDQWERMSSGFSVNGIIAAPSDTTVVYGDSSGMQVKVRAAKLGMVRGHGWYSGSTEFTKAIGANSSGSTRIDLVVLKLTRSTQVVSIEVKAGTPGAGAPALTQDAVGAGVYEISIAQVTVANGAATISAANVVSTATYVTPGADLVLAGKVHDGSAAEIADTTSSDEFAFANYSITVPQVAGRWIHLKATFEFWIGDSTVIFVARILETNLAGAEKGSKSCVPGGGNVYTGGFVEAWVKPAVTGNQVYIVSGRRNSGSAMWGVAVNGGSHSFIATELAGGSVLAVI